MRKVHRIAPEVKEQILRRIKDEGVSVSQAAKAHGVAEATIYSWLGKGVRNAPRIGELARLKRRNEELLALVGELTFSTPTTAGNTVHTCSSRP
jgi:transposase-like protein